VFHHIPAARLTPSYCRRWWFGKGVSRARVDRLHPVTELALDLRTTRHIGRVPQFLFGDAARDFWSWIRAAWRGQSAERIRLETRLCFFLGYVWERQRERWRADRGERTPPAIGPRPALPSAVALQ
jgi:hypothetical protein